MAARKGEKACKQCNALYEGEACPRCGSHEFSDTFKGSVVILNPELSDIAKNIGIKNKGSYAIKVG